MSESGQKTKPLANGLYRFSQDAEAETILRHWWCGLEKDTGGRAALRRAITVEQVVFIPVYHRLFLQMSQIRKIRRDSLPRVAGLLALVKEDSGSKRPLAKQMGTAKDKGNSATVSELRFRRLLAQSHGDELYPHLARIIRLLNGKVDLLGLADAAYRWDERTRKEWAYDYYAVAPNPQQK